LISDCQSLETLYAAINLTLLAQVPQLTLRSGISTFFLNLRLASARNGLNLSHLEIAL